MARIEWFLRFHSNLLGTNSHLESKQVIKIIIRLYQLHLKLQSLSLVNITYNFFSKKQHVILQYSNDMISSIQ
jgi:hypothetical protein